MTGLRIHLVPTALVLLGLTWIASKPNGTGSSLFWGFGVLLAMLTIAWPILAVVSLRRPTGSRLWVIAAPLLVAAVVGPQFVVSPLEARWHFAQPSFDRALAEVRPGTDNDGLVLDEYCARNYRSAASFERSIGSYQVTKAWKTGANTYFAVEGAAGIAGGSGGFVHRPRGASAEAGSNAPSVERLTDEWFTFECST
jgi:hypothetical protein